MELNGDSKLLRIFVGEIDKVYHTPLYEAILFAAKKNGMAGCTVIKGTSSYGASSIVHTQKWIDISEDLPMIVEIIDHEEKINSFLPIVEKLLAKAECGGLITLEKVCVLHYQPKSKNDNI